MTEETKEKIKLETELLRFLVLIGIALGGSTLGILIGLPVGIRLLLVALGIVATLGIGYMS
jgi:hypothetical protein